MLTIFCASVGCCGCGLWCGLWWGVQGKSVQAVAGVGVSVRMVASVRVMIFV